LSLSKVGAKEWNSVLIVGAGLRRSCSLFILQLWRQAYFLSDVFTSHLQVLIKGISRRVFRFEAGSFDVKGGTASVVLKGIAELVIKGVTP